MYTTFFGLTRLPFEAAPAPHELFRAATLDELHSRLSYLVSTRSTGLVTGEPGTGKSTALRRLRDDLHPDQVRCLYLFDTDIGANDFCRHLALELGLEPPWSRASTFRAIQSEIQRLATERRLTVLLVVDEAHALRTEVLALLPRLTNFEWDASSRLALLLAGQTGLRQRLRLAHLEALAQRVTVRFNLDGLDRETTSAYLEHRLRLAGLDRPLFTEPALEALFAASRGVMRRVDGLAHYALATAATNRARLVEPEHVLKAAEETRA
jgi:type II secretory pathway predicted ATPase ExeA